MKKFLDTASKILIPRFDTFGDLVLMEGFVEQLRESFPAAEITMFVRKGYEQIAPLFPASLALKWLSVEGYPYHEAKEQEKKAFDSYLDRCLVEPWDLVVFTAFNRTWMDNALASKFRGVLKVALGSEGSIAEWPSENLHVVSVEEKSHETFKYQALLSMMTGKNDPLPSPRLELQPELMLRVAEVVLMLGVANSPYVACVPAGTQNQTGKVWPVERYNEVLSWSYSEYGYVPLLLGHKCEQDIILALASKLEERRIKPYVWLGEPGEIPLLAGLIQRAQLYIGNDTGPMHIAAAVGVPVVGVFGGGTFPRFLPVGERAIGIAGELPCFGCYWDCMLGDAPCMRVITVEDAKKAVRMVLDSQPLTTNYLPVMEGGGERLREFMQMCMLASTENMKACENVISAMKSSRSWRVTRPLRIIGDWMRKCVK